MPEQLSREMDILIVDDDAFSLKMAEKILDGSYHVLTASSGEEALEMLTRCTPQLILLDLFMPGMDGRETMKKIQEREEWKQIPIIFLTEKSDTEIEKKCLEEGALDFILKPFVPAIMLGRINRTIEFYGLKNDLQTKLEEKTMLVQKVSLNSIMAIANTIDAKDPYTSGHSVRVARCAEEIARRLGWSEEEVTNIHYIALLHDIGKIGVPDTILNKPSRLSEEEFSLIKKHPVIGSEILKDVHMIKEVAAGALYHHERYDGKGYPFGLKGEDIPMCARIIGIADTYDAMTSNRIYRAKLSDEKVIEEFKRCAGTQFDPKLAALFVSMLEEGFHVSKAQRRWQDNVDWEKADAAHEDSRLLTKALTDYRSAMQGREARDSLTGLHNRGYGQKQIDSFIESGGKGAFLIIDLDNYKRINNTFGYITGDMILKKAAEVLTDSRDGEDIICRLGGDEFVMFFAGIIDRNEISARAEKLIATFSQKLDETGCRGMTSLSIGITVCPDDGRTFAALYNRADKALYYAKRSGKKTYALFSGGDTPRTGKKPDLDHIRALIEGYMDQSKGALKVDYEEFKNLYNYISRCVKRKGQMVQTLLFTIGNEGEEYLDNAIYEGAMNALEVAVAYSLRMVDVGSRYSSLQYIVILVDTNLENGKKAAERVVSQFYKTYSGADIILSYDIQTMTMGQPDKEPAKDTVQV